MTIKAKTSGSLALSEIQDEFGGTNPISLTEYYSADSGIPASGTISVDNFYGRSKQWSASYTNNIVSYSIPVNAGGIGEGFWRTAADWYNGTDRQGQVRLHGIVGVGVGRGFGTKITGYAIYVDGSAVAYYPATFGGPAFWSWDVVSNISRGSYVYLSVYLWGGFNGDRVKTGTFNVGAG